MNAFHKFKVSTRERKKDRKANAIDSYSIDTLANCTYKLCRVGVVDVTNLFFMQYYMQSYVVIEAVKYFRNPNKGDKQHTTQFELEYVAGFFSFYLTSSFV